MRFVLAGLAAVVLFGSSTAVVGQRSGWAERSCFHAVGHADLRACLEGWAKVSANALAAEEKSSREYLATVDQVPDDVSRALAAFEDASQAYRIYREKECDYVASLAFGGNGAGDRRLLCRIDLDRRRASDLKGARGSVSNNSVDRSNEK